MYLLTRRITDPQQFDYAGFCSAAGNGTAAGGRMV
jgi:hypothetical protein